MAWKECNKMDQKLKFIARYLEGEKTGYRYKVELKAA